MYTGCPKKAEPSILVSFKFENIAYFDFIFYFIKSARAIYGGYSSP